MFFDSYCQHLIFGRKTGHWAASPLTFDIFLIFLNFLRGNSCIKFVMVDIKCRFTCGDSDLGQIIKKCQNIMMRIVWKLSFTLYISNDDSIFWKKYQFWLKNFSSLKKQLIGKTESFLESNFDLNQGYKIVLTQKN